MEPDKVQGQSDSPASRLGKLDGSTLERKSAPCSNSRLGTDACAVIGLRLQCCIWPPPLSLRTRECRQGGGDAVDKRAQGRVGVENRATDKAFAEFVAQPEKGSDVVVGGAAESLISTPITRCAQIFATRSNSRLPGSVRIISRSSRREILHSLLPHPPLHMPPERGIQFLAFSFELNLPRTPTPHWSSQARKAGPRVRVHRVVRRLHGHTHTARRLRCQHPPREASGAPQPA